MVGIDGYRHTIYAPTKRSSQRYQDVEYVLKEYNNTFKAENIIKIGDFGISKSLGTHNDFARTFLGTPYFMPPEVCKGEPYGCKADVWALGCALYELVTFKRPFQHDLIQMVFDLIIKHPYDAIDPSIDKDLVMLIDKMLQKDPSKRPSIWELGKIPCIEEKT